GGAIYSSDATTLTSDVFGGTGTNDPNTASGMLGAGGAVQARGTTPGTTDLNVTSCTFTGNKATDANGVGGAIYTWDGTSVQTSTFTSNSAGASGGAIYYDANTKGSSSYDTSMTLNQDTFTSNTSRVGGAVESFVNIEGNKVAVMVTNSTFFLNQASATT